MNNFCWALENLKEGRTVCRDGWNGNLPPKVPQKPQYTPVDRIESFDDYTFIVGSRGSVAVIDTASLPLLGGITLFTEGTEGYFYYTNNSEKTSTRLHQMLMSAPDGFVVDHINRDILDNRMVNLRFVTPRQNTMNRKPKGRFKGVCFDAGRSKFNAAIQVDGKSFNLGRYETGEEAARAYDVAALKHHGKFAYLNFPDERVGMCLFLVPDENSKMTLPYIYMCTVTADLVPWLASQTDMLACDWNKYEGDL